MKRNTGLKCVKKENNKMKILIKNFRELSSVELLFKIILTDYFK